MELCTTISYLTVLMLKLFTNWNVGMMSKKPKKNPVALKNRLTSGVGVGGVKF